MFDVQMFKGSTRMTSKTHAITVTIRDTLKNHRHSERNTVQRTTFEGLSESPLPSCHPPVFDGSPPGNPPDVYLHAGKHDTPRLPAHASIQS
ncbi:unnamed protein product [Penicillium camemberti]|uniref:Str. FM013 n=1 Tax=Penicillium camemberti (strain FM 013) TaxID=1429867 RepID=A0A0G4P473_PENC3|nr:unnamed protein product [Penicillium camemberti]